MDELTRTDLLVSGCVLRYIIILPNSQNGETRAGTREKLSHIPKNGNRLVCLRRHQTEVSRLMRCEINRQKPGTCLKEDMYPDHNRYIFGHEA